MRKGPLAMIAAAGVLAGALPALAADHIVTASGASFSPRTITIAPGDKVIWNNGGGTHSVLFDDGSYRSGDPTTSSPIGERTFPDKGEFKYHCEFHGTSMAGTVVVTDTPPPPTPTPTPSPGPTPPPGPTATPDPTATPPAPALSRATVARRLRRGRVLASVDAEPAGAELTVRVRAAGRAAGSATRTLAAAGRVTVRVRLSARARRSLARNGRLRATARFTLAGDGGRRTLAVTVTLRA